MVAGFVSDDPNMTQDDIADYVASNIKDPISRSSGVGEVQLFGAQYAMRIWLDPNKLNNYQLTTTDVTSAITEQNNQIAAGQLGGLPPVPGQQLNASIIAQTRLTSPEEFGKILLKVNTDGSQCACATSLTSSAVRKATPLPLAITASLPPVWVSNWLPAPTP